MIQLIIGINKFSCSNSTEEAHYSLSSAVLERAFDALLIADRPAEMRQLYFDLSSSISRSKKDSKASSESDSSAKVSIPLRAARLSKSLYLAALLLDDIILIKTVFRNCNKLNYQRGNNNALVSSNSADSELILKELTAALLDIAKQNRRINGYDFGIALVLNLLNGNVKEVAHLWNSLIVRIIDDKNVTNSIQVTNVPSNLNPNSADGISDANNKDSTNIQSVKIPIDNIRELSNLSSMDDAVSVLTLLSNAILSCSMNGDQLRSAKDFLNQVLFMSDETFGDRKVTNLSTNAMTPDESTYDISSNNSRYNTDIISLHSELQYTQHLVEELTQTFGTLKDSKAASKLLISALQQQVLLSDDSLTTVMQLLQHDGDDELVLDCFKLYQQNIGNRQRNNQSDTQNSKKNSRTRHQRNISSHSAKVPCPQIYYHAIKSLNKVDVKFSLTS